MLISGASTSELLDNKDRARREVELTPGGNVSAVVCAVCMFFCFGLASVACKRRAAEPGRRAEAYAAAVDRCLASVGRSALSFPDRLLVAYEECAALMGPGACGDAWMSVPHTTRDERVGRTRLSLVIEACRDQHCPAIASKELRACAGDPDDWALEEEQALWAVLHAAILPRVFGPIEGADFERDATHLAASLYHYLVPPVVSETITIPADALPADVDAPHLELFIARDGLSIGVAEGASYWLPRCGTEHDASGLVDTVCKLREDGAASSVVDIAAADEISYDAIIAVMDDAIASGLEMSITDAGSIAVDDSKPPPSPWSCGRRPSSCDAPPIGSGNKANGRSYGPEVLREALVLVVSTEEVHLGDRTLMRVRKLERSREPYDQDLANALRDAKPSLDGVAPEDLAARQYVASSLILQADKRTSAKVLTAILKSAHVAGYPNVMFAINSRSRGREQAPSGDE